MKIRCIEVKTGRIFQLEDHITRDQNFMSKYGYRVEDLSTNPIKLNQPAQEEPKEPEAPKAPAAPKAVKTTRKPRKSGK